MQTSDFHRSSTHENMFYLQSTSTENRSIKNDTQYETNHFFFLQPQTTTNTKMALKRLQYVINAFLLPVSKFIEHYGCQVRVEKNAISNSPTSF